MHANKSGDSLWPKLATAWRFDLIIDNNDENNNSNSDSGRNIIRHALERSIH